MNVRLGAFSDLGVVRTVWRENTWTPITNLAFNNLEFDVDKTRVTHQLFK
jgi:hypothetical protein